MKRNGNLQGPGAAKGMTLVEVMISLGIVAIAILGIAAMITSTQKGARMSQALNVATALGNDKMEELKTTHYLYEKYPNYQPVAAGADTVNVEGRDYTRTWTLQTDKPVTGMTNVVMKVTWDSGVHGLTLETGLAHKVNGSFGTCP